jgi:THO complex subunit 3
MMKPLGQYPQKDQTNETIFTWPGKHVFLTCGDGTLKLVKWPTMELVHSVHANNSMLVAIDLSPNGDYLATGGSDSLISVWDYKNWFCERSFSRMTGPVRSISFSFDSSYLVGGSEDGTGLEIAHVYSGEYVYRIETAGLSAPQVQWSPRSYALAYAGENGSKLKIVGDFEHKIG